MTNEELKALEERIKAEVLEEVLAKKKTESKVQASNKALKKTLQEDLNMEEWTIHRVVGAVNVFIKACSGGRNLRSIDEKLIEPITESCLEILRMYRAN